MVRIELEPLTAHIWRLAVPSAPLPPADKTNLYLIGDDREAIMVDAGYLTAADLAAAQAVLAHDGWRVTLLLFTHHHADHLRFGPEMAAWLHCPMAAHPLTAKHIPAAAVQPLHDGQRLTAAGVEIQVIDAPGHTNGHLHLWVPADRAMLVADNLAGEGTVAIIPPEGSLVDYLVSLRHILDFDPAVLLPAHGPALPQPRQWVEQVIAHRLQRESQILALLGAAPRSRRTLTEAIYAGTIPAQVMPAAELTVQAHLEKLLSEGRVRQVDGLLSLA